MPFMDCTSRTQILFGGSASGKSVFLAQRCVKDVLVGKRNYLVVRQIGRTIRGSVFAEISRVIDDWNIKRLFAISKTDMLITCINGCQIIFAGLDDTEKLKSLVPAKPNSAITDIWIEEATETERNSIKQLYKRQRGGDEAVPKRLTLSFNPILQNHWLYEEYFRSINWAEGQTRHKSIDLSILKTWYIHNRFLTPDDIKDLENETDTYFYNVYTLGNWGVLGNVIFTNWRVEDLSEMKNQFTNTRNGGDFGFSSNPAAAIHSHYDSMRKIIYIFGEIYETGLTNDLLADEVKKLIGKERIVFDSAEPKSIAELQKYGVSATGAEKGKDSVTFGIQWLQQQTIIIDVSCINTRNEFQQYKWKEDAGGHAIPVPVDKNNHLIDAIRYAYESDSQGSWYIS